MSLSESLSSWPNVSFMLSFAPFQDGLAFGLGVDFVLSLTVPRSMK